MSSAYPLPVPMSIDRTVSMLPPYRSPFRAERSPPNRSPVCPQSIPFSVPCTPSHPNILHSVANLPPYHSSGCSGPHRTVFRSVYILLPYRSPFGAEPTTVRFLGLCRPSKRTVLRSVRILPPRSSQFRAHPPTAPLSVPCPPSHRTVRRHKQTLPLYRSPFHVWSYHRNVFRSRLTLPLYHSSFRAHSPIAPFSVLC